jgi:hypothetical protein
MIFGTLLVGADPARRGVTSWRQQMAIRFIFPGYAADVARFSPAAGEPTCVNALATLVKSYAELFVNAPSVG